MSTASPDGLLQRNTGRTSGTLVQWQNGLDKQAHVEPKGVLQNLKGPSNNASLCSMMPSGIVSSLPCGSPGMWGRRPVPKNLKKSKF